MANSKYSYVKNFETDDRLIPDCWIVVRVDGKGFTKCAECGTLPHAMSGHEADWRCSLQTRGATCEHVLHSMVCRFSANHGFEKPNDAGALALMDAAAQVCHHVSLPAVYNLHRSCCTSWHHYVHFCMFQAVMQEFRDIVIAYGESDEYSFVLRRSTELYRERNVVCLVLLDVPSRLLLHHAVMWRGKNQAWLLRRSAGLKAGVADLLLLHGQLCAAVG